MSTKTSARWGQRAVKLLLRFAVASSLLSAVADRLGLYPKAMSVWGDMKTFSDYTHSLMSWLPKPGLLLPVAVWGSTVCELLFGLALLFGLRLRLFALLTGSLILIFALAMATSVGPKVVFDYSALNAAGPDVRCSPLGGLRRFRSECGWGGLFDSLHGQGVA